MKNRFYVLALALAASVAGVSSAQASEPNYTYVQASYNWAGISPDGAPDIDLNGWNLEGSYAFTDHFYGFAAYQDSDGDDWNASTWNVGAGYKTQLSALDASWFTQVKYIYEGLEYGPASFDESDSGFGIGTGLRFDVSNRVELATAANYTWVNGVYGDGFGLGVSGEYKFNKTWSSTLGYAYNWRDDLNISDINVGVRANF